MWKALRASHIPRTLLTVATHVIVPVDIRTLGVVPPSPDVQLKERRYVEAVWAANELEDLAIQHRRSVVMAGQPSVRKDYVLDAHQSHAVV